MKLSILHITTLLILGIFFGFYNAAIAAANPERGGSGTQEVRDTKNEKDTPTSTGNIQTDIPKKDIEDDSNTGSIQKEEESEKDIADKKLKKEINTYIVESYKAQGNKIIKDLSAKLTKSIPNSEDRKIAYEKIRFSLIQRINQTKENLVISDTKREILIEFLEHLTELLDKKISELE